MQTVAIIGGGAAGLSCACELAYLANLRQRPLRVTVYEAAERVGKKLLVTGNGRCNLTNLHASAADYNADARDFVAPALAAFPPGETVTFFERLGLYTHVDTAGRVYPLSNQASGVLDALRLEAARLGVEILCGHAVQTITQKGAAFLVDGTARFDALVLSCGGKAAVRFFNGDRLLRSLGVPMTETAPALVKLTTPSAMPKQLRGVRAAVGLRLCSGKTVLAQTSGELQFSDGVLSGICAMDLSPYVNRNLAAGDLTVEADFVPTMDAETLRETLQRLCAGQRVVCEHLLSGLLPKQLGLALLRACGVSPARETKTLTARELSTLTKACKAFTFPISGTKGFADAQVMLGGAALRAFDPQTLEARHVSNLYCCGELLDVDGPCGGYNLQWAFASARLCAKSIVEKLT